MAALMFLTSHWIKARTHAYAEIAHFPTWYIIRTWNVLCLWPHASQALMMHLTWKCAISTWAWVLAIIQYIQHRSVKGRDPSPRQMWKCAISKWAWVLGIIQYIQGLWKGQTPPRCLFLVIDVTEQPPFVLIDWTIRGFNLHIRLNIPARHITSFSASRGWNYLCWSQIFRNWQCGFGDQHGWYTLCIGIVDPIL